MSVMEIFDVMESFNRRQRRDLKLFVSALFIHAESSAEHVGMYLNKENKARQPWEFYPELFKEEEEQNELEELERQREKRRTYAAEWERRYKEK